MESYYGCGSSHNVRGAARPVINSWAPCWGQGPSAGLYLFNGAALQPLLVGQGRPCPTVTMGLRAHS